MAKYLSTEWTHHTFNPWWGCQKVSPACKHCYAQTWAMRLGKKSLWGARSSRQLFSDRRWSDPLKWDHEAKTERKRRRVFCASMSDWVEDRPDLSSERERLYELIGLTPWLEAYADQAYRACCCVGALGRSVA